jgi:hypothetical protein
MHSTRAPRQRPGGRHWSWGAPLTRRQWIRKPELSSSTLKDEHLISFTADSDCLGCHFRVANSLLFVPLASTSESSAVRLRIRESNSHAAALLSCWALVQQPQKTHPDYLHHFLDFFDTSPLPWENASSNWWGVSMSWT